MDALVFVEEEDTAASGVDDLLDLVFAKVGIEARFLVEAVGFVDNQGIECIGSTFYEGPRTFEERPVAGLGEGAGGASEFALQSWAGYKFNDDYVLNGGLAYRFGDAAEVMAGVDYRDDLRVTLSYDVNLSSLNAATNSVGGFELSAFYILKIYKKPDVTPAILCPVF